jgi:predicted MFS family arabinose efflux permease
MAPAHMTGRAIAIAMIGEPLALLVGMPGGTFLGTTIGWRSAFGLLGVLAVILIGWVLWKVPDFPGRAERSRPSVAKVMAIPGIGSVLFVTVTLVLADATLYVYIAPFLAPSGLAGRTDLVLFVFGAAALIGIWIVGALIDKRLRALMLLSSGVFLIAAVMLGLFVNDAAMVLVAVAAWGLGYGGVGALLQTACGRAAGPSADVAQSIFVTCWNGAIAGGGVLGGILLSHYGAEILPWSLVALLVPTLLAVWFSRSGFART